MSMSCLNSNLTHPNTKNQVRLIESLTTNAKPRDKGETE